MNNLLSYCGLVDARISASEKDLPVRIGILCQPKRFIEKCFHQIQNYVIQLCTIQSKIFHQTS